MRADAVSGNDPYGVDTAGKRVSTGINSGPGKGVSSGSEVGSGKRMHQLAFEIEYLGLQSGRFCQSQFQLGLPVKRIWAAGKHRQRGGKLIQACYFSHRKSLFLRKWRSGEGIVDGLDAPVIDAVGQAEEVLEVTLPGVAWPGYLAPASRRIGKGADYVGPSGRCANPQVEGQSSVGGLRVRGAAQDRVALL